MEIWHKSFVKKRTLRSSSHAFHDISADSLIIASFLVDVPGLLSYPLESNASFCANFYRGCFGCGHCLFHGLHQILRIAN